MLDAVLDADSVADAISRVRCFNNRKCQQRLNATTKEDKQAVVDKKLKTRKVKQLEATEAELETKRQDLLSKQSELNVMKASLALEQSSAESSKAGLENKSSC